MAKQSPAQGKRAQTASELRVELDVKRRELHGLVHRSCLPAPQDTPGMLQAQPDLKKLGMFNARVFGRALDYGAMIRNRLMPASGIAWRLVSLPRSSER